MPTVRVALALLVVALAGCSPFASTECADCAEAPPPSGLECPGGVVAAGDADSLKAALAGPAPKCVMVSGEFAGSFTVPAGITVMPGAQPATFRSDATGKDGFALSIEGGTVVGVTVARAAGDALRMNGAAVAREVTVEEAGGAGVLVSGLAASVHLDSVTVRKSAIGLYVASGGQATVQGGVFTASSDSTLASGYGVLVHDGMLTMTRGEIRDSAQTGLVISGPQSIVRLTGVRITGNKHRGVSIGEVSGVPAVALVECTIEHNKVGGVLVRNSAGVLLAGGVIGGNVSTLVPDGTGKLVEVGDGVVIAEGSSGVTVEKLQLRDNARAQAIVDHAKANVRVEDSVDASGGLYAIVVQDSPDAYVPARLLAQPPQPLSVW